MQRRAGDQSHLPELTAIWKFPMDTFGAPVEIASSPATQCMLHACISPSPIPSCGSIRSHVASGTHEASSAFQRHHIFQKCFQALVKESLDVQNGFATLCLMLLLASERHLWHCTGSSGQPEHNSWIKVQHVYCRRVLKTAYFSGKGTLALGCKVSRTVALLAQSATRQ